jgi:sialate O-acetylesterase
VARAAAYPDIRITTVGTGTTSYTPLQQLATIQQNWTVASPATVGVGNWSAFSAVCWLFGRNIHDALGGKVPIGLMSVNWGGTRAQAWVTNATNALCNTSITVEDEEEVDAAAAAEVAGTAPSPLESGPGPNNATVLYNAMINPYVIGPMRLKTITFFQAEQNAAQPSVYACIFPALVTQWQKDFAGPSGGPPPWFGFVILEPWITTAPLAQMRDAQLMAMALPNVGYASAQDIGDPLGPWGSVHPRAKQIPSARLAASALNMVYGIGAQPWTGPSFASASGSVTNGNLVVTVALNGLGGQPVQLLAPTDAEACPVALGVPPNICAWPQIQASSGVWVNATLTLGGGGTTVVFTAPLPAPGTSPVGVSYAYGIWPVNLIASTYQVETGFDVVTFPLLPFNKTVTPAQAQ